MKVFKLYGILVKKEVGGNMDIILSFVNTLSFLFQPILNLFRTLKVNAVVVDCHLDIPKIPDGECGYIHGSYAHFKIEIINRKDKKIILSDIFCKALCQDEIIQDNICCYDKGTYKRIAAAPTYERLTTLNVPSQSSIKYDIIIKSNEDLSQCDKLILSYTKGIKKRKIIVWEK